MRRLDTSVQGTTSAHSLLEIAARSGSSSLVLCGEISCQAHVPLVWPSILEIKRPCLDREGQVETVDMICIPEKNGM